MSDNVVTCPICHRQYYVPKGTGYFICECEFENFICPDCGSFDIEIDDETNWLYCKYCGYHGPLDY